ncbi:hypothetical protein RIF29_20066 [Crotalaria pallida]|uniref:Uncharacterized protein n=1 Tax=Crotalaria pallida TaxID=3830 RepID=A0AAN9F2A1_CROPI
MPIVLGMGFYIVMFAVVFIMRTNFHINYDNDMIFSVFRCLSKDTSISLMTWSLGGHVFKSSKLPLHLWSKITTFLDSTNWEPRASDRSIL